MNVQRFNAATSREALAKARMAFGDATLILSNRQTPTGVEVVATTEDMLDRFTQGGEAARQDAKPSGLASGLKSSRLHQDADFSSTPVPPMVSASLGDSAVESDVEKLAMSTLSFQDYVRERMLRRRHEALHGSAAPSAARYAPTSSRSREGSVHRVRTSIPSRPCSRPARSSSYVQQ